MTYCNVAGCGEQNTVHILLPRRMIRPNQGVYILRTCTTYVYVYQHTPDLIGAPIADREEN